MTKFDAINTALARVDNEIRSAKVRAKNHFFEGDFREGYLDALLSIQEFINDSLKLDDLYEEDENV